MAEEINYSLSFISGIESAYHQTFSLGAIWRISIVLGVDFYKLCEDDSINTSKKYITYKCNKCDTETKIPIKIAKHFKYLYEIDDKISKIRNGITTSLSFESIDYIHTLMNYLKSVNIINSCDIKKDKIRVTYNKTKI